MEPVYTVEETAALLKVTPLTIRRWLNSGKLRGIKLDRLWRIKKPDLESFLERHVHAAEPEEQSEE